MTWGSAVPAAIAALYAVASDAEALSGVSVSDGPVMSGGQHPAGVLTIGYPGGDEDTSAESSATADGWSTQPDREDFTISCAASFLDGAGDLANARAEAYGILNALGAALAADHTLGGVVMRAMIAGSTLHQSQNKAGAVATVSFGVACEAFTQL